MDANDLQVKDLDFADIEFTYESDDGMRRSSLDHVVVSSNVLHRIQKIYIMCDGASSPSIVSSCCSRLSSNRLAWYKATSEQIHAYKSLVAESCHTIEIPDEVLNCTDPNCLIRNSVFLSRYVHNCLMDSAAQTIPKCGGKRLADWNEEVRQFKDKSILWNKIWREAGCPSVGVLFQLRKHAKSRYKYAVRRLIRNQDLLR